MDIEDLKFDNLIDISKSTKVYYRTKFKKIITDVFDGIRPTSDVLASKESYKKVSEYIKSPKVTLATKKPMYNSWIRCLQELKISTVNYLNDYHKVSKKADEELSFNVPSQKEIDNKISFKDLSKFQKKWKKLLVKDQTGVIDIYYIICSLYLFLEPLRTQDYINTRILSNCKKANLTNTPNYICLKCSHMIIKEFKTDKIHDERIINISTKLNNIIKTFYKKSKYSYLVSSPIGSQLQQPNFYTLSVEACGISTNMMRKVFVSEKLNDNLANNIKRKESARVMGHKPSTQASAYSKFSVLISDKEDLETLKKKKDLLVKLIMETDNKLNKLN